MTSPLTTPTQRRNNMSQPMTPFNQLGVAPVLNPALRQAIGLGSALGAFADANYQRNAAGGGYAARMQELAQRIKNGR